MTKNEIFALDNHTCGYPENKTYEEILQLIEDESDSVIIWEPFEHDCGESIVEKITDMIFGLNRTYPEGGTDGQ
jgi:hypothetical protein